MWSLNFLVTSVESDFNFHPSFNLEHKAFPRLHVLVRPGTNNVARDKAAKAVGLPSLANGDADGEAQQAPHRCH